MYCVTMHITLPIPEFTRNERDLHCDVLRITTDRVVRLFLDDAIAPDVAIKADVITRIPGNESDSGENYHRGKINLI